ncbi:MAG: hypothetical protein CSA11_09405 [Chloroflexi bacterium]|nr:MAG: hypothetical protein CSA11_09405 [Chloroflexota bacterium]
MHYIIDGHNLIGSMPDISLKDPNDEVKLVLRIKSWLAESKKRQVTLFFDSGSQGAPVNRLSSRHLKVIFAPVGKTADSLIIRHLHKLKNPRTYTLVTSDQEIVRAAKSLRIAAMLSEEFVQRMGFMSPGKAGKITEEKQTPEPEKPEQPIISEAEVQEWLDLFGPVPQRPKRQSRSKKRATAQPPAPQKKKPTLRVAKTDDEARLDQDEIDLWLDLFGSNQEN